MGPARERRSARPAVLSESFGLVVLEVLGVGTPVVVTPEVGAAEIVRRHDLGAVETGEPEPLARVIGELLRDRDRRCALGARAPRLVRERYSWPAIAAEMAAVYARPSASRAPDAAAACSTA